MENEDKKEYLPKIKKLAKKLNITVTMTLDEDQDILLINDKDQVFGQFVNDKKWFFAYMYLKNMVQD